MKIASLKVAVCAAVAAAVAGAGGTALGQSFVGLGTGGTTLTSFGASGVSGPVIPITGLAAGDTIVDIDFFSSGTGQLFGMGSSGRLYTLTTGGATSVATLNAGPVYTADGAGGTSVGTPVAIDFNPAADRLRVFSGTSNFRITPGTGLLTSDGPLAYVAGDARFGFAPNLVAAAYINNFDAPASTTLYSIDADSNSLVVHSVGPQFSTLATQELLQVGGAGAAIDFLAASTGFDVLTVGGVNTAYVSRGNTIYTVTLNMGMVGAAAGDLTLFTTVTGAGGTAGITDFAVIPAPGAAVVALAGLVVAARRRRMA